MKLALYVFITWAIMMGALVLASAVKAQLPPHHHGVTVPDWYDPECCNQRDCRPVREDEIEFGEIAGEAVIVYKPLGIWFPKYKWKSSQDERYHVCFTPDALEDGGTAYCAYIPGGA